MASSTSPIGFDTNTYTDSNGVYLSPFTMSVDATSGRTAMASMVVSAVGTENDAATSISGSIGSVAYHDRAAGVNKGTLKTLDSSWIVSDQGAYGVFNALKSTYDSAVTTYNTEKTAYEADTSKDKPDMPQTFGTYAGP